MRNVIGDKWKWHGGKIITNTDVSASGTISCDDGSFWHSIESYLSSIKNGKIILVETKHESPIIKSLLEIIK